MGLDVQIKDHVKYLTVHVDLHSKYPNLTHKTIMGWDDHFSVKYECDL